MIYITIFLLKIIESFMSTIVTIEIINGKRIKASIYGFIQVIIWYIIIKQALDDKSYLLAISYAGGYSLGTFFGTLLTKK